MMNTLVLALPKQLQNMQALKNLLFNQMKNKEGATYDHGMLDFTEVGGHRRANVCIIKRAEWINPTQIEFDVQFTDTPVTDLFKGRLKLELGEQVQMITLTTLP